jgi:hypothetical protein
MIFILALWRSKFIFNVNMQFSCKQGFSVSACFSKINRRCLDEKAKWGQNVPLSCITAPLVLAHLSRLSTDAT